MAAAPSSHKVGTHETHVHHQGGTPPFGSRAFPSEYHRTNLTAMDDEMIEVRGFDGYMHVRCHASSPRACYCGRYSSHTDSMIIAIDGACPSNGTDKAVMSTCGVYLGPGANNWSWRVSDKPGERHTSSRAEIHAAIGALKAIMPFHADGGHVVCEHAGPPCRARHIVIKSDSSYLVNSITQHVEKWRLNGWKTAKKTPVKNRDLW
ncbi:Ribonuclease H [Cytospora mali]|uniref:ribonuclease H n=1 Tax=Cytospora mali TaxID=578113 RepID=A0A194VF52_CYTMA|nr:Ribonuclease H [Valsa mali var. pyri (nom. inval.)]